MFIEALQKKKRLIVPRLINGVKIFNLDRISKDFIKENFIKEIIISIQNVKPERLLEITDHFISYNVEVKIVPPLSTWIDGDLQVNQIRDVKIEDLLDRPIIQIDNPILHKERLEKAIDRIINKRN